MIALRNFKNSRIRPQFLLGLGAHLGANGLLFLAVYYLVAGIGVQEGREVMSWVVPAAQGCCFFAAVLLGAGLSLREPQEEEREHDSSRGWMIRNVMSFGNGARRARPPVRTVEKKPAAADLERTLSFLKGLDWRVFRNLGVTYFRELGFRVVDEPDRSNGVDFLLYTEDDYSAVAVRCLPWGTERVDLKQVRNVHRAMLLAGAVQGVMLTTGVFEEEAIHFGEGKALELLGGEDFVARLLALPPETSEKLLHEAAGAESIRRGVQVSV